MSIKLEASVSAATQATSSASAPSRTRTSASVKGTMMMPNFWFEGHREGRTSGTLNLEDALVVGRKAVAHFVAKGPERLQRRRFQVLGKLYSCSRVGRIGVLHGDGDDE